jgi:hypothetical protein
VHLKAQIMRELDRLEVPAGTVEDRRGGTGRLAETCPRRDGLTGGHAGAVASQQLINGNTKLTFPDHTSITLVGISHVDANFFT